MATNCKVRVLLRLSVMRDLKCDKGPSFDYEWITLAKGAEVSGSQFHEPPSLTKKKATFGVREQIIKACSLTLMGLIQGYLVRQLFCRSKQALAPNSEGDLITGLLVPHHDAQFRHTGYGFAVNGQDLIT